MHRLYDLCHYSTVVLNEFMGIERAVTNVHVQLQKVRPINPWNLEGGIICVNVFAFFDSYFLCLTLHQSTDSFAPPVP